MICPGCERQGAEPFLDGGEIPVFANVLHATAGAARDAPRARFALALCPSCTLVFNPDFDPAKVEYAPAYENALHFSPRFCEYAEGLATSLAKRYDLAGGDVVEIGCGDGHFLGLLARSAGVRGFGFDPSHDPARAAFGDAEVEIRAELYSVERASVPADLVLARHLLEHVRRPLEFLQTVRAAVGERAETALYLEVPNGLWILEADAVWDLIYEHATYFTPAALAAVAARAGFRPVEVAEVYDGQFLALHALPGEADPDGAPGVREPDVSALARGFAKRHRDRIRTWAERIETWSGAGRTVAAWGAGAKGVTFLDTVPGAAETVSAIVDLNPRKRGRFVTGSGTPIVAPEALGEIAPDVVLVMNPAYRREIADALGNLGLTPEIEVVT